jgi:hypothetical protein
MSDEARSYLALLFDQLLEILLAELAAGEVQLEPLET